MSAGPDLGDRCGSLKPRVPLRRFDERVYSFLTIYPVKGREDFVINLDPNAY